MQNYQQIHQHILTILENRQLDYSFVDIIKKHNTLSFKFWRLVSFFTLIPVGIYNISFSQSFVSILIGHPFHSSTSPDTVGLLLFLFGILAFLMPIGFSTFFLSTYLPLYKLSEKTFFKKYFSRYFNKFPTLVSSCNTMHYKNNFILQYSQDSELNLSLASYYDYLLEFPFSLEEIQRFTKQKNLLLDFDINPSLYQKNLPFIITNFIEHFKIFSTSPTVLTKNYQEKLNNYAQQQFSESVIENDLIEPVEIHKKNFKDML